MSLASSEPGRVARRVAHRRGLGQSGHSRYLDHRRGGKHARRLTFDPADDDNPVWSPDGTTIAFSSNRRGQAQLYMKPADGLGEERLMTDQPGRPTSWSKDGRYLLFTVTSAKTLNDIWVLPDPVRADAKPSSWLPPNSTMRTATSHLMAAGSPTPQNGPTTRSTSGRSRPVQAPVRPDQGIACSRVSVLSHGGVQTARNCSSRPGYKISWLRTSTPSQGSSWERRGDCSPPRHRCRRSAGALLRRAIGSSSSRRLTAANRRHTEWS